MFLSPSSFFFSSSPDPPNRPSFPTRRSSDLEERLPHQLGGTFDHPAATDREQGVAGEQQLGGRVIEDRKSTRLNSSHANISYAVFCLKKKTKVNLLLGSQDPAQVFQQLARHG